MDNGEEILLELLEQAEDQALRNSGRLAAPTQPQPVTENDESGAKKDTVDNHAQWAIGGNGKFMPVGATVGILPSGVYEPFASGNVVGLEQLAVASDGIYTLPDMATEKVLEEVQQFWASEPKYRHHKLLYKRGILLWGPPGGGKTVTVKLLMNELVKRDGIVVVVNHVPLAVHVLKALRRIEPARNLIMVLEDIDEIINYNGESSVLSMLDGENNIDNILHLATTNYPQRLGARIINRPSRFDRRVFVGMPGPAARREYLTRTTNQGLSPADIEKWVTDTDDMSIAHLRELVAAVYCLEQPYDEVVKRLKEMAEQIKDTSGFKEKEVGFAKGRASMSDQADKYAYNSSTATPAEDPRITYAALRRGA